MTDNNFYWSTEISAPDLSSVMVNRAFCYADGFFETVRWVNGHAPLWEFHKKRIVRSAIEYRFSVNFSALDTGLDVLRAWLSKQAIADFRIRLVFCRKRNDLGSYPGFIFGHDDSSEIHMEVKPFISPQAAVDLCLGARPLIEAPYPGVKNISRTQYLASIGDTRIEPGEQILFYSKDKQLVETMHHNIYFIQNERIYTPKLSNVGVAGVFRDFLTTRLPDYPLLFEDIALADVPLFDGCFITNALSGVTPVGKIRFKDKLIFETKAKCLPLENVTEISRTIFNA